jgi:hypothetical protein
VTRVIEGGLHNRVVLRILLGFPMLNIFSQYQLTLGLKLNCTTVPGS